MEVLFRKAVRQLASFPLAIALLFAIAALCAVGTVVDQGALPADYVSSLPADAPLMGVLTVQVFLALGFDHVYSSPLFLSLLLLLAGSLAACTSVRQMPMLRVARRWSFLDRPQPIRQLDFSDSLDRAQVSDLATLLMTNGYQVFQRGPSLYAFKGLVGRLAPIGVHAALLLVMAGGCYSALGGFQGTTLTPQGLDLIVPEALQGNSVFARPTSGMNMLVHVNRFYIEYRPNGEVKQFFSDLIISDPFGRELVRKTISVNDPLRCQGITMYQTDWAISALQLRVDGAEPFNLPMAPLQEPGSSLKLFGTFLPLAGGEEEGTTKGISILARDLQNVVVYDSQGEFVGVRRPGSNRPITVEGVRLVFDDLIGATGLELKMDPGVPYVYAGFGALMLTTAISYLSHSQVWALQSGTSIEVGGRSNRAKLSFVQEMNSVLDQVPEVLTTAGETEGAMESTP